VRPWISRIAVLLILLVSHAFAQAEEQAAKLRALIAGSPHAPLTGRKLEIKPPSPGWTTDYISAVAHARDGTAYVLHRNLKADPVLAVDEHGKIIRSWGKGLFTNPHGIRIDPDGNIWTVDSGSSVVMKFSPEGKQLLRFEVGELPQSLTGFRGATDIAFAGSRLFVADGYGNARVLEYDKSGRRVRQWGSPGEGHGEFKLPHGIAARDNIIYIADRQNGRIQRFNLDGKYLGEWTHLGKTFSISVAPDGNLWIGTHPRNVVNEAPGWIVNVDRKTGRVIGYVDAGGLHSLDLTPAGEVISVPARGNPNMLVWFRRNRLDVTR
jgi:DNA-binding beta-propeller fold protein YncE